MLKHKKFLIIYFILYFIIGFGFELNVSAASIYTIPTYLEYGTPKNIMKTSKFKSIKKENNKAEKLSINTTYKKTTTSKTTKHKFIYYYNFPIILVIISILITGLITIIIYYSY